MTWSDQEETYNRKYHAFLLGLLTEKEWIEYCHSLLDILLRENKDVLYRLRDK